jgi:hypothetical protein
VPKIRFRLQTSSFGHSGIVVSFRRFRSFSSFGGVETEFLGPTPAHARAARLRVEQERVRDVRVARARAKLRMLKALNVFRPGASAPGRYHRAFFLREPLTADALVDNLERRVRLKGSRI